MAEGVNGHSFHLLGVMLASWVSALRTEYERGILRLPLEFHFFAPPVADEAKKWKLAKRAPEAQRTGAMIEQAEWQAADEGG
jgi:hypothetical protein